MEIIKTPQEMQDYILNAKKGGKLIGLVPTMGALHEGHLSLIRQSHKDCALTVVSIFVNPTQFGPNEDYNSYPRDFEKDRKAAEKAGADIIFDPTPEDIYPINYQTYINLETITKPLCGASRPGHFQGVATVVCKLFNIVMPDKTYFGQKDYQQTLVIKQMVNDLNMRIEVIVMPIVRDKEGLALSSRNNYLNIQERYAAKALSHSLQLGKLLVAKGETDAKKIEQAIREVIEREVLATIGYITVCDAKTLEPLTKVSPGKTLIALAVKIGKTRLIDNCLC